MSVLRPMTDADHPEVLALNEAFVHLLAPLEEPRLRQLRAWVDRDAVIELDGGFAGFVLTFAAGSPYDGDHFAGSPSATRTSTTSTGSYWRPTPGAVVSPRPPTTSSRPAADDR